MKILVTTTCSQSYLPLSQITYPTLKWYGHKWGLEVERSLQEKQDSLSRLAYWRLMLDRCDWLFFLGADAMITNLTILPDKFTGKGADFIFAIDWNGLQTDSFWMRSHKKTKDMLDSCTNMLGNNLLPAHGYHPICEQDALMVYLCGRNRPLPMIRRYHGSGFHASSQVKKLFAGPFFRVSPVKILAVDQHELNSFPYAEYGDCHIPATSPHGWRPGDFVMHMPGRRLEHRIEAMKRYRDEIYPRRRNDVQ